jgi:hypothetical protein
MLTNKRIAESGIALSRVRRWAKEFLPPDPRATRRSGFTREYAEDDGWKVFLGGHIVGATGCSFNAARNLLDMLDPWMKRLGLFPEIPNGVMPADVDKSVKSYICYFLSGERSYPEPQWILVEGEIKRVMSGPERDASGLEYVLSTEKVVRYWLGNPPNSIKGLMNSFAPGQFAPFVMISDLLRIFIGVCGIDFATWDKRRRHLLGG